MPHHTPSHSTTPFTLCGGIVQFVKIPKDIITKHPGAVIKVYGAIESHLRRNKASCYPGNERLMKLTGIKTRSTLSEAKKVLKAEGWIEIKKCEGKSNTYIIKKKADFKLIPIEALLLSNKALKLYCVMLYVSQLGRTEIVLKNIKKFINSTDNRTLKKSLNELQKKKFIRITKIPEDGISDWVLLKKNVVITEHLSGNYCTGMWELLNTPLVITEHKAAYMEVRLLEATLVKQKKSKPKIQNKDKTDLLLSNQSSDLSSNIKPITDISTNTKQGLNTEQEKNNFSSDTEELYAMFAVDTSDLDRITYRNTHKINLKGPDFEEFKAARKKGFNGYSEIVNGYVKHETPLWDMKKCPIKPETLRTKLEKEIYTYLEKGLDHAIVRHYLEMTPEQRELELAGKSH